MCSTKQSNWVTFDDDGVPPPSPQKSLDLPGVITASVPCPNGVKLEFPSIKDTSWSFSSPQHSSQSRPRPRRQASAPCGSALSAALCRIPSSASSSHSNKSTFSKSFSSSGNCMSSSASESPNHSSDEPSPFPSFQGNLGHYNPFWEDSGNGADAGSSSSDSDTNNSLPRFFIRTKDGREPPRSPLQNSFSYVCNKLENLQAGADDKLEVTEERRLSGRTEVLREGSSQFAPRGLFRSKNQDGWPIMLRIPEKKNRMSSRQWGPIYLRLLPGGVLQMYYEKGLEKPYKEFQLLPQCRLSDLRVESYSDPRKVLTVKVEHFSYTEKKRYHPKVEVSHEAEVEQLLKFGSTVHEDMEDLVVSMEEEIFKLGVPHQQSRHYEEQELSLQITDHIWIQLDKCGEVMERSAFTQIHCLAFLNGHGGCFLALNDLGLLRSDSSYGSEDSGELWMEIADCHLHKCVNEIEFKRSRLIKFSPPDACRVELMRYKTTALGCTDMPFSVKAVVTVQGAYVELQAFLNMSGPFLSSLRASGTYFPLCENVVIRVPVPGHWVRVTQTAGLLRQRSLKARMNRNACLGSVGAADSQPVMQVSIGSIKYESVYSAVVWRIDKLPAKNTAVDHPHSFCCRLELGSDQEIPNDWYPFVTMEAEIMGAVVSQTKVKSLGTANDIQPQKHVTMSASTGSRVSCGRDLDCVPEIADTLAAVAKLGFDFLCMPLFHPRFGREFELEPAKSRPGAQTRSDLLLCGRDWGTLIVGKLSPWIRTDSEIESERRNSEEALAQELNFSAYLGLPVFMVPLMGPQNANLARLLLNHIHTGHHTSNFWIRVPLMAAEDTREDLIENEPFSCADETTVDEKTWNWWHTFRTLCDYNKRICLAIEIGADMPSDAVIDKWMGEPIKAAILPTSIFLTNKKGFPVLSKAHQRVVFRLFKLEAQFIFTGTSRHTEKDFRSYLQYLEYLNQNRSAPNAYELFAKGYEDYLQSPLQPLMDNLESQTYEVFEKDPVKYSQYQKAVCKCLLDRVPEEQKDTNVQVLMVLGAGRGPLVNASLRAASQANRKLKVYAVEKNPNAVITLENWRFEEWGDRVTVVSSDMREWEAPEKADIIVSELLGSFGDNELSPECLDGAQHFLKDDGVSIPCSYTSFLAPLSSSKLYNEVRGCRERDKSPECHFETPYVVRLHNFHELADPKPCFTFTHPKTDMNNNRYQCLRFSVGCNSVLHGFAGYFETTLYKDITLSIKPDTHSPGMFSWFPILFPLKQPISIARDEEIAVRFWRCNNGKKVWYEWAVTEPSCSAIHNPAGRSYTIGL